MHDSSTAALCVFPCLEPHNLFSILLFQPGNCYLFTRSCDYQFLCGSTSASPGFSPVVYVFYFLSSAVCFPHLHLSLFYL